MSDRKSSKQGKRPDKSTKGYQTPHTGSGAQDMNQGVDQHEDPHPPFFGRDYYNNQYTTAQGQYTATSQGQYTATSQGQYTADQVQYATDPSQYAYSSTYPASYGPPSTGTYPVSTAAAGAVNNYSANYLSGQSNAVGDQPGGESGESAYPQTSASTSPATRK